MLSLACDVLEEVGWDRGDEEQTNEQYKLIHVHSVGNVTLIALCVNI